MTKLAYKECLQHLSDELLHVAVSLHQNLLGGFQEQEEASKYFARMNEDIRRHDEQVVYSSFCEEMDRDRDM